MNMVQFVVILRTKIDEILLTSAINDDPMYAVHNTWGLLYTNHAEPANIKYVGKCCELTVKSIREHEKMVRST